MAGKSALETKLISRLKVVVAQITITRDVKTILRHVEKCELFILGLRGRFYKLGDWGL